jgi:hypothetical protein
MFGSFDGGLEFPRKGMKGDTIQIFKIFGPLSSDI